MKYGLIGKTLKHSYSKIIHEMFGKYQYELINAEENELEALLKNDEYSGFNVTIPYKKTIIPYCDEISEEAKKIGSVNTVLKKNGRILGYNTDYDGFLALAKKNGISFKGKKTAVLGSGGTCNTVCAAAKDNGAGEIIVVSRNGEYNYQNADKWKDSEIIINTTPVGMYPNNGEGLIDIADFEKCVGVIDVIYNPLKTRLVYDAEKRGIKSTGGLYMLLYQAKRAFEIFTGEEISELELAGYYEKLKKSIMNIVFIGMPGSGKSTAGEYYAKMRGKKLFDTDRLTEKKAEMKIPEIFEKYGEETFRKFEAECVRESGKQKNSVIACGGGVVKNEENLYHLAQNGKIVWIKRSLNSLATDGRPLLKNAEMLSKMEEERKPLYEAFAEFIIENDDKLEDFYKKLLLI